jgi:translocation protein SEC62
MVSRSSSYLFHPLPLLSPLNLPIPRLTQLTYHLVGFWDSFKPVWVWDEKKKSKKKSKPSSAGGKSSGGMGPIQVPGQPPPASATTGSAAPQMTTSAPSQRNLAPRVEEVFDE